MGELTWSHLTADTVGQWADLTNELARADQTQEFYEAEDLAEELTEAGMTPATDTWAVWDGDDLVASGSCASDSRREMTGRCASRSTEASGLSGAAAGSAGP